MKEVKITYTGKQDIGFEQRLANLMHRSSFKILSFTRQANDQTIYFIQDIVNKK